MFFRKLLKAFSEILHGDRTVYLNESDKNEFLEKPPIAPKKLSKL